MKRTSSHLLDLPGTRLGQWSVWLEIVFVFLLVTNVLVLSLTTLERSWWQDIRPIYVMITMLCGLAGGVLAVFAVTREHEHSLLIWFSLLCGLFAFLLFINEMVQGAQYLLHS